MSKILLIDNYDSFTYNLYHYLEELSGKELVVMRNDEIEFDCLDEFDELVISPGPGLPIQAGQLMNLLRLVVPKKKVLGICLGQQAIAEHFGMKLINLKEVVHGQSRLVKVLQKQEELFQGIPSQFKVGRYHSWVIDPSSLNAGFEVTSVDEQENIMSISHKTLPIKAVQFHPESVLTEFGKEMISNWLCL